MLSSKQCLKLRDSQTEDKTFGMQNSFATNNFHIEKIHKYDIFPWYTMLNLDKIYAISEVIIPNNNQHQRTMSANNRITSKIIQQHTPFVDWWHRGFVWENVFAVLKFVWHGKTISWQTEKGNRVKQSQIYQGNCVRMTCDCIGHPPELKKYQYHS